MIFMYDGQTDKAIYILTAPLKNLKLGGHLISIFGYICKALILIMGSFIFFTFFIDIRDHILSPVYLSFSFFYFSPSLLFFFLLRSLSFYRIFQLLIIIYRRGNFVYHHRSCTIINRPLSYPSFFLSLSS